MMFLEAIMKKKKKQKKKTHAWNLCCSTGPSLQESSSLPFEEMQHGYFLGKELQTNQEISPIKLFFSYPKTEADTEILELGRLPTRGAPAVPPWWVRALHDPVLITLCGLTPFTFILSSWSKASSRSSSSDMQLSLGLQGSHFFLLLWRKYSAAVALSLFHLLYKLEYSGRTLELLRAGLRFLSFDDLNLGELPPAAALWSGEDRNASFRLAGLEVLIRCFISAEEPSLEMISSLLQ